MDPFGVYTTLLVGIDPKDGFFVAADPAAHNPTKFFIRLEFKDQHAEEILSKGWYAWERSELAGGYDEPIEVLVGGTKERFLDLIHFERAACNLSPGDRQLLAEKPEIIAIPTLPSVDAASMLDAEALHPLVKEFSLDTRQILELIANARRLKMAVRGWVAETHLRQTLLEVPGVTRCESRDEEGGPDLYLSYKGGRLLTIECKNVLRVMFKDNLPRIDFQRTHAVQDRSLFTLLRPQ
ncbi:MAG: hypothetical protein QM777_06555 [Pseudorhodoferax sp.]